MRLINFKFFINSIFIKLGLVDEKEIILKICVILLIDVYNFKNRFLLKFYTLDSYVIQIDVLLLLGYYVGDDQYQYE